MRKRKHRSTSTAAPSPDPICDRCGAKLGVGADYALRHAGSHAEQDVVAVAVRRLSALVTTQPDPPNPSDPHVTQQMSKDDVARALGGSE
jgi:hypothetical protein